MRGARRAALTGALSSALFAAACAAAPSDPVGVWGGPHVSLIIEPNRAQFEFDCAFGRIDGPFIVDAGGRFDLSGLYAAEFGGPARIGETPTERPARYRGAIAGKRMSLSIELSGESAALASFSLVKDAQALLTKCL